KLSNCHIKIRLHISKAFKLNIPIIGMVYKFFYPGYGDDLIPPSFPTRRSSDLSNPLAAILPCVLWALHGFPTNKTTTATGRKRLDRKSTRLNSSHVSNSYAVFCLKKKKKL